MSDRSTSSKEKNRLDFQYYDTVTVATTNVAASLFTVRAGKTAQQTNMPQDSRIAANNTFRMDKLRLWIKPLNAAAILTERDVHEVQIGFYEFRLNGIPMWQGHGMDLAAGGGLWVNDGTAAAIHAIQNGIPSAVNVKLFDPPLEIRQETIELAIQWNPAITLATSAILTAKMDGQLLRVTS